MNNVLEYLNRSVNKFSEKIAVIEEDKKLTYKELNDYSKKVGSFLASSNIINVPVVIFMDKGIDALISFFGVVYSSSYYTLINPEFPQERINQIIENIPKNERCRYFIDNELNELKFQYAIDWF